MPNPQHPRATAATPSKLQTAQAPIGALGAKAAVGQYVRAVPQTPSQRVEPVVRVQLTWPDKTPVTSGICVGDHLFREFHPRLDGLVEFPQDCLGTTLRLLEVPSRREIGRAVLVGLTTQQVTVPQQSQ